MNITTLLDDPVFLSLLGAIISVVYHYVAAMPYSEFVLLTQVKHRVALLLQPALSKRGLRIVTTKQYREDDEYLATVDMAPRAIARAFKSSGIDQHIIAGSKRRETPTGLQWSHSHWTYQHDDGTQTEAWLFPNGDGTVDVYAHNEESVFDPDRHLETPFTPGDPRGVISDSIL